MQRDEDTEALVEKQPSLAAGSSRSVFIENPPTNERFIYGVDGEVFGKIVSTAAVPAADDVCWYCQSSQHSELLYKPCSCASLIHRDCFRKWRTGWINPRNYFSCPNCMYSYNIERVKPATTESKERMKRNYRIGILKLWIGLILFYGALVGGIAGIAYGSDTEDKNIPVGMRFLLTSVVSGFPTSNSTAEWRADFKLPNVHVWPYYSMFGIFVTSVFILIAFAFIGCTFEESDRRRSGHCNCCDDCCAGTSNAIWVWNAPTSDSCCNWNIGCNGRGCGGGGGGGDCGGCDGGGDAGPIIAVILIIIVVIIIFSALFVVVLLTIQKCSLLYDRTSSMLDLQQSELEGETVVLGIHESWRPNDAV